ncbi:MAG: hypothetical protein R3D62_22070 [Xanthobacteraceae bacterium]
MVGQLIEQPFAISDLDTPAFHDKDFVPRITLAEDDVAGFEVSHRAAKLGQQCEVKPVVSHLRWPPLKAEFDRGRWHQLHITVS